MSLPKETAKAKSMLGSWDQALDAFETDREFVRRGDVFTKDVIETWLEHKGKEEVNAVRLRPIPGSSPCTSDI
jgi:glutamine synthetase